MADNTADDALVMIHPRVTSGFLGWLKEYCRREHRDQSNAIRHLLEEARAAYESRVETGS